MAENGGRGQEGNNEIQKERGEKGSEMEKICEKEIHRNKISHRIARWGGRTRDDNTRCPVVNANAKRIVSVLINGSKKKTRNPHLRLVRSTLYKGLPIPLYVCETMNKDGKSRYSISKNRSAHISRTLRE